jgi:hypothetical protein
VQFSVAIITTFVFGAIAFNQTMIVGVGAFGRENQSAIQGLNQSDR